MANQALISVGSNIDPEKNIAKSKRILAEEQELLAESKLIKTKPAGFQDQADFLNGAYLISSDLSYEDLNHYLKDIEKRLGRVKGPIKSGPRTIDLDIIVFNNKIVHKDFDHDYVFGPIMEIVNSRDIELENLPKWLSHWFRAWQYPTDASA